MTVRIFREPQPRNPLGGFRFHLNWADGKVPATPASHFIMRLNPASSRNYTLQLGDPFAPGSQTICSGGTSPPMLANDSGSVSAP
jgi:hypothetical protein